MKDEIVKFKNSVGEKVKQEYIELGELLKRERDELKLSMHLANADAHDQWHRVEAKWERFQSRASVIATITEESAVDIGAATKEVGEEIKEAYRRIRQTLDALKHR